MSRPAGIRKEVLLEAARRVFLRHGYKATTKHVAKEAGVSEGSLFKHFRSKKSLFMAAMQDEMNLSAWDAQLKQSAGTGDLRKNLETLGTLILDHMQIVLPRIMMVRSSGITFKSPHQCGASGVPHPIQKLHAVANYLRAEIKKGRLVMDNPEVAAQIFMGTLINYVFQKTVFGFCLVKPAEYVRTIVDMILRSATPAGKKGKR